MGHERRRWFHHNLTGIQAEKYLLDKGVPGSFLARPSHSNPGSFTLSVRRDDFVTHIRIQNTGDFLDLYGGEKFATLSELIDYYRDNHGQLKETNGSIIQLKYPLFCQDPVAESSRWFHGRITGKEAQNLLLEKGKYGSFLVRESVHKPDSYVLSVVTGEQVSHILIHRKQDGKFDIGGGHKFPTLKELIDFYITTPMVEKNGGLVCLKQPFNATRVNVSNIDKRMRQLERESIKGKRLAGFSEEFEELHQDVHDTKMKSRSEGAKAYNMEKNRYKNILPFDPTQVVLRDGDPNLPGSSYINANYIIWPATLTDGLLNSHTSDFHLDVASRPLQTLDQHGENRGGRTSCVDGRLDPLMEALSSDAHILPSNTSTLDSKLHYIATQGPLPNTVTDFWRMVWQEQTSVIVMITKEVERGRNKCWRYWPTSAEGVLELPSYGGKFKVKFISELNVETYTLRELFVSRDPPTNCDDSLSDRLATTPPGHSSSLAGLTVYLFQFHAWPDHGTPNDPSCVLNFMFDISVRHEAIPNTGPMIVHCSAGIGRTGTFIVINMLIYYIREMGLQSDIDISRTVEAVREQRSGMVQTETQYRFIYKAVHNFVSTLTKRVELHNELQPYGVDYTNINQDPSDLCRGLSFIPTLLQPPPITSGSHSANPDASPLDQSGGTPSTEEAILMGFEASDQQRLTPT